MVMSVLPVAVQEVDLLVPARKDDDLGRPVASLQNKEL
jgi:hypothetical protein